MSATHEVGDDVEGQEELVEFCRREYPKLVGILGLYTGDVALAEELAQDALLRVWRHWDTVRELAAPAGWAYRVAMNLATSALRSRLVRWHAHERLRNDRPRSGESADPADVIALRQAIRALPDRQRQVLVLRYYADLPVAEVAAAMRCPEGTVKTLTSRAITALRSMGLKVEE